MALDQDDLTFTIEVDSNEAVKLMKMINTELIKMKKASDKADDSIEDLGDEVDDLGKKTKSTSDSFKLFLARVANTNKVTKAFAKNIEKAGFAVVSINQALDLAQRSASLLIRPFGEMSNIAKSFGAGIAEINTLLDDNAIANANVSKQVANLAIQFGQEQTTAARAFYQAISSGAVNAFDATEGLTAAGKLAVGGITSLDNAVDGLTTIMNAYELSASDSNRITDAFFIAMKKGKTTVGDLAASISNVTPIASSLGVELEEVLGTVSAITTDGTLTAEAVTQLRSALTGLSKQTPQLAKVLNDLNIASIKTAIEDQGLVGLLNTIISQTDGSTEKLTELFGRIEAVNGILTLTGNASDNFADTMNEMAVASENAGKVTEEAFKKIAETDQFRSQMAIAQLKNSMRILGEFVNMIWIPILESAATAVGSLTSALDALTDLDSDISSFAVAVTALSTALTVFNTAAASSVLAKFGPALIALLPDIKKLAADVALAAGKFLLITGAIAGVLTGIDLLIRNWELWETLGERVLKRLQLQFATLNLKIQEFFSSIQSFFGKNTLEKAMIKSRNSVSELESEVFILDKRVNSLLDDFDFGSAGKIFDLLTKDVEDLGETIEKTGKKAKEDLLPELSTDQKNALLQLEKATAALQNQRDQFLKTDLELINLSTQAELDKLDILEKQLTLKGAISDPAREELKLQREITKEIGERQKLEAVTGGGAIGEIGGSISSFGNVFSVAGDTLGNDMMSILGSGLSQVGIQMAASISGAMLTAILKIPDMLNSFADFVDQITDFPMELAKAFENVFNSLIDFATEFVPNIIKAAENILMNIADFFVDFPDRIAGALSETVPELFTSLVDKMPDIARKFAEGFVSHVPKIAIALAKFMSIGVAQMTVELVKAMPEIAQAFVNGIVDGLLSIGDSIADFLGIGDGIGTTVTDAFETISADLSKTAQDTFAVLDLTESGSANLIMEAAQEAVDWLSLWWKKFIAWLTQAFTWIDKHILQPFLNVFRRLWEWVDEKVLQPFMKHFQEAWKWVDEKIIKPLMEVGKSIWDSFTKAAGDTAKFFGDLGTKIWDGLKAGLNTLGSFFQHMFDQINPANMLQKMFQFQSGGVGTVEKALGIDIPWVSFARGGVVPGRSMFPGDDVRNDTVPAMLSPGEVVIPRSVLDKPGVEKILGAIMGGVNISMLAGGTFGKILKGDVEGAVNDIGGGIESGAQGAASILENAIGVITGGIDEVRAEIFGQLIDGMRKNILHMNEGGVVPSSSGNSSDGGFLLGGNGALMGSTQQNSTVNNDNSNVTNQFFLEMKIETPAVNENRLAASVMDKLKRESARGKWIIDTRGLRTS
jgi:TP901 family phage tail tape measure protein